LCKAGDTPHLARDLPVRAQKLCGCKHFAKDRAGSQQPKPRIRFASNPIHTLYDALHCVCGHRRLLIPLVYDGDVVEDVTSLLHHFARAMIEDHRDLVGERRIVCATGRDRCGHDMARSILMLKPLATQCGTARRSPYEESARTLVRSRPAQVT